MPTKRLTYRSVNSLLVHESLVMGPAASVYYVFVL